VRSANEINLVRKRAYGTNYQPAIHGFPNQTVDADINVTLLQERLFDLFAKVKGGTI
jgi:hypothetical protein